MDSEFLIYDKRAGVRHVQTALGFALILLLACLAILPCRLDQLPRIASFIPVIDTVHLLFSCIIAAVLLSLASILRSRALIALGTGYVFIGFIAVAHALTYPETFSRTGLLGATIDTVSWLYIAWHTALAASMIAYVLLEGSPRDPARAPGRSILFWLICAILAGVATTYLATAGGAFLSHLFGLAPGRTSYLQYFLMVLFVVTMALLWRGKRSILDLCLILTLWGWLMESFLIQPPAERYSVGWYAGRVMGLSSGLFVLLMLLIEMSRLYARTVMLVAAQKRERENRLMLGEAVGAFIAHELRQPLAAIGLNAYTAQKLGAPAGSELSGVLDDLMSDSRRANDIIESTRALFGEAAGDRRSTDLNQLIRDTLLMTSHDLRNNGVRVELELDEHLPLLAVNRIQMQQALMNLIINAAEAMSGVAGRPRQLTIGSGHDEAGLVLRVEDTGPSIQPDADERIFDPFFTTKEKGTGMGLSICRSVVHAHGGTIRMTARTPFGACFEILLPGESATGGPAQARSAP